MSGSDTNWNCESWTVGQVSPSGSQDSYKIVVYERDRDTGTPPRVRVRVWDPEEGRRVKRSLGMTVRDENGQLDPDKISLAQAQGKQIAQDILEKGKKHSSSRPTPAGGPTSKLTLGQGFALALRPKDKGGKYREDTRHRGEVIRARNDLFRIFDRSKTWASLTTSDYEAVWETVARVRRGKEAWRSTKQTVEIETGDGKTVSRGKKREPGWSWAEKMVSTLLAVGRWLEGEDKLPAQTIEPPQNWRGKLKKAWREITGERPDADKPRYGREEFAKLWSALPEADPRVRLALRLGAELRLGQVMRARRSHLNLSATGEFDRGTLEVVGRGEKKGTEVHLTPDQRDELDDVLSEGGYLYKLEEAYQAGERQDYPLFPQNVFKGGREAAPADAPSKTMARRRMLELFHDLEEKAGVEHEEGRGWYGLRRLLSDTAADYTSDDRVLNSLGGWANTRTREAYQESNNRETVGHAARVRHRMRRELREGLRETPEEVSALSLLPVACQAAPEDFGAIVEQLGQDAPEQAVHLVKMLCSDENGFGRKLIEHVQATHLAPALENGGQQLRQDALRLLDRLDEPQ